MVVQQTSGEIIFKCARLGKKWRKLEREKTEVLESLVDWRPADLAEMPSPQQWSAVQVLDHLVLTESAVLAEAHLAELEAKFPTVSERLRVTLFDWALRLPLRVKVPEPVRFLNPSPDLRFTDVCRQWESVRARWQEFLQIQDCAGSRRVAMRHPIVGNISLAGAVGFMRSHLIHHRHQFRRIQASIITGKSSVADTDS